MIFGTFFLCKKFKLKPQLVLISQRRFRLNHVCLTTGSASAPIRSVSLIHHKIPPRDNSTVHQAPRAAGRGGNETRWWTAAHSDDTICCWRSRLLKTSLNWICYTDLYDAATSYIGCTAEGLLNCLEKTGLCLTSVCQQGKVNKTKWASKLN